MCECDAAVALNFLSCSLCLFLLTKGSLALSLFWVVGVVAFDSCSSHACFLFVSWFGMLRSLSPNPSTLDPKP